MDLRLQGWSWLNKGHTLDNLAEARRLFERALALDPANVWGLVGIGYVELMIAVGFLAEDDRAARFSAAEAAAVKALTLAPENASPICAWVSSKSLPTAPLRASGNASGRWNWIEIWPTRTRQSATARFNSARPRRPRLTFRRLCASVPATRTHMYGVSWPGRRSFASAARRRRWPGCAAPLKPTDAFQPPISLWRPLWRVSDVSPRRDPRLRPGLSLHPTFTISRFRAGASNNDSPAWTAGYERIIEGMSTAGLPEMKQA